MFAILPVTSISNSQFFPFFSDKCLETDVFPCRLVRGRFDASAHRLSR